MVNRFGVSLDRNGYAPSIVQGTNCCYICGRTTLLQRHEPIGAAMRQKSKNWGLWVYLCPACHRVVHTSKDAGMRLKQAAQRAAMERRGLTVEAFRQEFYKSYL